MQRLIFIPVLCAGLAGCMMDGGKTAPAPTPQPVEKPAMSSAISMNDAAATCKITASTKFGVGLSDVVIESTKKVDAGYLSKVKIGTAEKNCVIAPDGSVRSLQ